jgi:hypothetical protein
MEGFQLFRATQLVSERERDLVTGPVRSASPEPERAAIANQKLAQPFMLAGEWLTLRCRKANGQPWKTLRS